MNELALVNLHKVIGTITDSVMDYIELPDELKRRDRREPGRLRKMAYEEKIARVLRKRWKKQKEKIEQVLGIWYPGRKATWPTITPDDLDNPETETDFMLILLSAFQHGVQLFEDAVLIGMDYSLVNARAVQWAKKYTYELIKDIDKTTIATLQNAISAFANTPGMTIGDVVDMLPFSEKRSLMIAVTEITRAYATAELEAGRELKKEYPDILVVKQWLTNNDEIVCAEICEPLNEIEVEIDKMFPGGYDSPPAHVNCRCWISQRTRIGGKE